jgi:hypothetical protein
MLSLVVLPAVLALLGLVGFAFQLNSPAPAHTAAEIGPLAMTPSGDPDQPSASSTSQVRFLPGYTLSKKKPQIPKSYVKVSKAVAQPTSFNVVSFNALGFSHTARGGDRKGWAPGTVRMRAAVGLLRAQGASVVGFQEFQGPQYATFHALEPAFEVYPGASLGTQPLQNSIAWDTREWTAVRTQTTPIPYFYGPVPMPQVLLRNVQTGRMVWFGNFHNPADKFHPAQAARTAATSIEASLANGFVNDGYPVILTGDMNERDSFFCRISGLAPMHAADGSYRDSSGCHSGTSTPIDWIVGTTPVTFTGYVRDLSTMSRRISDHPLIKSTVTLPGERSLDRCLQAPHDSSAVFCPPKGG